MSALLEWPRRMIARLGLEVVSLPERRLPARINVVPRRTAVQCLDCGSVFALGETRQCPICASRTFYPVEPRRAHQDTR